MQLDHVLLRTFLSCVDEMNFNRAAQSVHRSPATVSTHIARLEAEIGQSLFLRNTRNLALTQAGEQLETFARRILRLHDEAASAFGKPDIRGSITIGAPDDFISQILPPALRRFGLQFPKVEIRVICAQTTALLPMVENGRVDIAVVTGSRGVVGRNIRREPMVWIASRDRVALEKTPLPVALFEQGSPARNVVLAALARSNTPYRATYDSFSLAGLLTIVEAGLAIAAVTRMSVPAGVAILSEPEAPPKPDNLDILLIRSARSDRPLCDALEELIQQAADSYTVPRIES